MGEGRCGCMSTEGLERSVTVSVHWVAFGMGEGGG